MRKGCRVNKRERSHFRRGEGGAEEENSFEKFCIALRNRASEARHNYPTFPVIKMNSAKEETRRNKKWMAFTGQLQLLKPTRDVNDCSSKLLRVGIPR